MVRWVFLLLLLLPAAARAQYFDGLPQAGTGTYPALSSSSIVPICGGGTAGVPATCKPERTTVGALQTPLGALNLKNWTTAGRPSSPEAGALGFNIDLSTIDLWNGSAWANPSVFQGGAVPNATTFGSTISVSGTATLTGGGTLGGSWSGALNLTAAGTALAVTNNATVGGTLTAGEGAANSLTVQGGSDARIQQTGTGAWVFQPGGTDQLFADSSGNTVLQMHGDNVQSQYQLTLRAQNTGTPAWSGSSPTAFTPLYSSLTWTGTTSATEPAYLGSFLASSDSIGGTNGATLSQINMSVGGASATGPRQALAIKMEQTSATGNSTGTGSVYDGAVIIAAMDANDNGTLGTYRGAINAVNGVAWWKNGATYSAGGSAAEFDIRADTGSSLQDKIGVLIDSLPQDQVHGSRDDAGLVVDSGSGAVGFNIAIALGRQGGGPPVPSTGTLIQAVNTGGIGTYTVANVMDFRQVTSTNLLLANGITIDGSGNTAVNTVTLTKLASAPVAGPGAGKAELFVVAGTNAGTCKIQIIAGTSATPVTMADNVGSGC